MPRFKNEQDLAKVVCDWLVSERYEVAQEVAVDGFGVMDIVARMGRKLWIIETKLSMSLDLCQQAHRRRGLAHRVSVAVPEPVRAAARDKLRHKAEFLRNNGVGTIKVPQYEYNSPRELCQGVFIRPSRMDMLEAALQPHHFSGEYASAGSGAGGHYTRFQQTARDVVAFVKANPSCSMTEIVEGVSHHYAHDKSARAHLDTMICQGVIQGIKRSGSGKMRSYRAEE